MKGDSPKPQLDAAEASATGAAKTAGLAPRQGRRRFAISFLVVAALIVAVDLWTKEHWFSLHDPKTMSAAGPALIGTWLVVHTAWNPGIPWGQLAGNPRLLALVSVVAVSVILWIFYRRSRSTSPAFCFGLSMILGGAVGNLFDRAVHAAVRDWILFVPELPVIGPWPIFNIADASICVGAFLVFFAVSVAPEPSKAGAS